MLGHSLTMYPSCGTKWSWGHNIGQNSRNCTEQLAFSTSIQATQSKCHLGLIKAVMSSTADQSSNNHSKSISRGNFLWRFVRVLLSRLFFFLESFPRDFSWESFIFQIPSLFFCRVKKNRIILSISFICKSIRILPRQARASVCVCAREYTCVCARTCVRAQPLRQSWKKTLSLWLKLMPFVW